MAELTQQELEELVEGKPQRPRAIFYDKARLNTQKSAEQGRRVYDTITYLKETQAGVTDWVPIRARDSHFKKYPEEYRYYLSNRQGTRSPSIDIIPHISPAELQEFYDYGLTTISALADADHVPQHLAHIHRQAKVIHSVFQEQKHGNEVQNEVPTETREEGGEGRNVPAPHRRIDSSNVRQPELPEGGRLPEGETAEGVQTGRRINDYSPKISDNWSISFG